MPKLEDRPDGRRPRIAVIGGGISGLATAYFLSQQLGSEEADILLLEKSDRWGGLLISNHTDEYILEGGPDSFVTQKPEALALCKSLGIEDRLIKSRPKHRQAYVFWKDKFYPLPLGLFRRPPICQREVLNASVLSWKGRLRALSEPLIPLVELKDESVSDFISRRLGKEVLLKVFEPLLSGVYGGDARQLSVRSTLPHLYQAERNREGLLTKPFQSFSGVNVKEKENKFISLKDGMEELAKKLKECITTRAQIHLQTKVTSVRAATVGYQIQTDESSQQVDFVVLATTAPASAKILAESFPKLKEILREILYLPAITVLLGYDRDVLGGRCGSGFLVPRGEHKAMLACTWINQKFSGRCAEGHTLLRCFISGEQAKYWMSKTDAEVVRIIQSELQEMMGFQERPKLNRIFRWTQALPQYTLGHQQRIDSLKCQLEFSQGLYLVGNFIDGVGIADCIRHAAEVSQRIVFKCRI